MDVQTKVSRQGKKQPLPKNAAGVRNQVPWGGGVLVSSPTALQGLRCLVWVTVTEDSDPIS